MPDPDATSIIVLFCPWSVRGRRQPCDDESGHQVVLWLTPGDGFRIGWLSQRLPRG